MDTQRPAREKEELAIVLDFLPNGYPFDPRPSHRKTPIVQVLGKKRFTLLELVPKKDVFLQPNDEIYIGEGKREQIHHILGKLPYNKLTSTGRTNLEYAIKDLVKANEAKFIDFFNKAQPMTVRMHQLELIPGVGKKHMNAILEEREKGLFTSLEELKSRVKLMPDPEGAIVKRIMNEIEGLEKHRIFTD
ncbi:DUF655 domain-containing protein [Candidatus Woesearchaeota archaeon]|nr:DUF655 domain-containing protein [Candidatus Woesearchaeota archaeon]